MAELTSKEVEDQVYKWQSKDKEISQDKNDFWIGLTDRIKEGRVS